SKLNRVLADFDAFISPAMDGPPFPIKREDGHGEYPEFVYKRIPARHTAIHNFNGSPTLTLPCGKSTGGLPLALQLVGNVGDELKICRLGQAFEKSTEFHKLRPPIS
ncbi:MAG: amidase family protein, partial [Planctomycetota bacterium]